MWLYGCNLHGQGIGWVLRELGDSGRAAQSYTRPHAPSPFTPLTCPPSLPCRVPQRLHRSGNVCHPSAASHGDGRRLPEGGEQSEEQWQLELACTASLGRPPRGLLCAAPRSPAEPQPHTLPPRSHLHHPCAAGGAGVQQVQLNAQVHGLPLRKGAQPTGAQPPTANAIRQQDRARPRLYMTVHYTPALATCPPRLASHWLPWPLDTACITRLRCTSYAAVCSTCYLPSTCVIFEASRCKSAGTATWALQPAVAQLTDLGCAPI